MTTHPHLEARIQERRSRRKRVTIGVVVIVALIAILIAVVLRTAGSWGVPGFSFTNEYGSRCKNNITGHVCSPMTEEHIQALVKTEIPEGAEMISSTYTQSGSWSMMARYRLPEEVAADAVPELKKTFGGCASSAPSTLKIEPNLSKFCVMTSDNAPDDAPDGNWTVTTARADTGDTILQIDVHEH